MLKKIREYRSYGSYQFSDQLLPTNSWNKNIHLFVKELSESELDLISRFYAQAAYIDSVIKHLSDMANSSIASQHEIKSPEADGRVQIILVNPRARDILNEVSFKVESIYNSPAMKN